MPRYTDIDALLSKLPDDLPYKASVKRVLIQADEADVVPKSEIENLKLEYAGFQAAATQIIEVFKQSNTEVAREIFEEIEKLIVKPNGMWLWQWDLDKLAELKKKYTGEKECQTKS